MIFNVQYDVFRNNLNLFEELPGELKGRHWRSTYGLFTTRMGAALRAIYEAETSRTKTYVTKLV